MSGAKCVIPKTFTVPTSSANEAIFLHGLWGRWGPTSWVSPIAADLVMASYRMPVEPDPEPLRSQLWMGEGGY